MKLHVQTVSMLPSGTLVLGFEPGRSCRIFKGEKNPQHAFLRRGSKAVGPTSQIFLQIAWNSLCDGKIHLKFLAHSSLFPC
jgi:hypothetical protein